MLQNHRPSQQSRRHRLQRQRQSQQPNLLLMQVMKLLLQTQKLRQKLQPHQKVVLRLQPSSRRQANSQRKNRRLVTLNVAPSLRLSSAGDSTDTNYLHWAQISTQSSSMPTSRVSLARTSSVAASSRS